MKQNKENDDEKKSDNAFGPAWAIAVIWAMSITIIIRRCSGRNYVGMRAFMGMGLIAVYASFTHEELMFWMIPILAVSWFFQANQERSARQRGEIVHSYYSGRPVIGNGKHEVFVKSFLEPAVVLAAALYGLRWNEAIARYFIIGSVMMFVVGAGVTLRERFDRDAMSDAMIEANERAHMFRGRR